MMPFTNQCFVFCLIFHPIYSSVQDLPKDPTCSDLVKCMNAKILMKLKPLIEDEKFDEACPILKPVVKCTDTAYQKCEKKNDFPKEQLKMLADQKKMNDQHFSAHCADGGNAIKQIPLVLTMFSALAIIVARLF